jgi:hypothetical protein
MNPTLQSIWLVDSAEQDPNTGKVNLSGLFNHIDVPAGADYASGATVFFAIRGVHGHARLTLWYVDLSDNGVLLERHIRVEGDPLDTTDVSVRVNRIPVPHSGEYAWELYAGDDQLGTARVTATVGGG